MSVPSWSYITLHNFVIMLNIWKEIYQNCRFHKKKKLFFYCLCNTSTKTNVLDFICYFLKTNLLYIFLQCCHTTDIVGNVIAQNQACCGCVYVFIKMSIETHKEQYLYKYDASLFNSKLSVQLPGSF